MRISILAEWTNECNLRCNICPISKPNMRPVGHMNMDLWLKILVCCRKEGHFVDWVHFFGEPLLWDHFFEGMKAWRESGLSSVGCISTNGNLLTDNRIECIKETGVKCVRICIDTLNSEVYKKIRGSLNHDALLFKTEQLLRGAPNVHCQVQFLQSTENPNENPEDFLKYFKGYKNLSVFVSSCQNIGGASHLSICRNPKPDPRQCVKVGYEHCIITWDGQVGLCCVDYALLNRLGNLSNGSISDIYLGGYAEKVRSQIRMGEYLLSPYCRQCPMDHIGYKSQEIF